MVILYLNSSKNKLSTIIFFKIYIFIKAPAILLTISFFIFYQINFFYNIKQTKGKTNRQMPTQNNPKNKFLIAKCSFSTQQKTTKSQITKKDKKIQDSQLPVKDQNISNSIIFQEEEDFKECTVFHEKFKSSIQNMSDEEIAESYTNDQIFKAKLNIWMRRQQKDNKLLQKNEFQSLFLQANILQQIQNMQRISFKQAWAINQVQEKKLYAKCQLIIKQIFTSVNDVKSK